MIRSITLVFLLGAVLAAGACALVDPIEDGYELDPGGFGTGGVLAVGGMGGDAVGPGSGGSTSSVGGMAGMGGSSSSAGGMATFTETFGERPMSDNQGVTTDTYLAYDSQGNNFGQHHSAWADAGDMGTMAEKAVALYRFDLSSIPQGSTVDEDATLLIWTQDFSTASSIHRVRVFELLEAWTEGAGTTMDLGVCNWNERTSTASWSSPGAEGMSYDPTELDWFEPENVDVQYTVTLPSSVVQRWVDDPGNNHGIVLRNNGNDGAAFRTSQSGENGRRPQLTVTFTTP